MTDNGSLFTDNRYRYLVYGRSFWATT